MTETDKQLRAFAYELTHAKAEDLVTIAARGKREQVLVQAEAERRIARYKDKFAKLGLV
jgi:hypothetical protein